MKIYSFIILLPLLISCNIDKTKINGSETITDSKKNEKSINDRLNEYFSLHELEPSIIINNTEGNQTDIKFSNHRIKWLNTGEESKIIIDNELITLKDKVTLNNVWNEDKDSVNFANNWDVIKFFKFNDRDIIGIRMSFDPCTGLGCSINYNLVYDLKTKTKNFFGNFRTTNELKLYHFGNDDKVDYISKTYKGYSSEGMSPIEIIYELYSMENNGQFIEQKNASGLNYTLKHTTFPNDTTKTDKFELNWIEKIK